MKWKDLIYFSETHLQIKENQADSWRLKETQGNSFEIMQTNLKS